jgi:hypothetical protein
MKAQCLPALQLWFLSLYPQVSILDTGEVCMELLRGQGPQERVKEVLRISCDGSMVSFRNNNSSYPSERLS